jgi:hypothetical protein
MSGPSGHTRRYGCEVPNPRRGYRAAPPAWTISDGISAPPGETGPLTNVARRRDGDMRLRWTATGLAEAQKSFRRAKVHRYLPELTAAIRRELNPTPTEEAAAARAALTHSPAKTPPKIYSGRDVLQELGALTSGAACWRPSSPGTISCSASRTGPRRADDHGRICGAGTGSGRQRERMTAAMRAMGELDAKDQGEVLLYMAKLRSKRGRG